jgi:hypothetical protein
MTSKVRLVSFAAATAAALVGASGAQATINLITNGSFETGTLSGWNVISGVGVVSGAHGSVSAAEDGNSYVLLEGSGATSGKFNQFISDTAGQAYTLSLWVDDSETVSHAGVSLNGNFLFDTASPASTGWKEYNFTFTGTGSEYLYIVGAGVAVDNFSVVAAAPDPATWALMLVGFAGVGAAIRARRSAAVAL